MKEVKLPDAPVGYSSAREYEDEFCEVHYGYGREYEDEFCEIHYGCGREHPMASVRFKKLGIMLIGGAEFHSYLKKRSSLTPAVYEACWHYFLTVFPERMVLGILAEAFADQYQKGIRAGRAEKLEEIKKILELN